MRLRKWVKVTIAIILTFIFMVQFTKWSEKEIRRCVNGGNTEQFCRRYLNQ